MKHTLAIFTACLVVFGMAAQEEMGDSITARELTEVTVNGERPQVSGRDGIIVVDLPAIVRDKPVSNILEALGYLPGVVNNNGLIGLAGASEISIILNGEPTNMPLQNLYQLLYNMPVERLKNVEVMYSAPAKYHVNGAVINLVLKTPRPLDGLQGQVRAGYNQDHYASYGGGLSMTYAVKDWSFDLNYGLSRAKSWNREETFSNHLYKGVRIGIEDDMRRISENWANTIYTSARYKGISLTYNGQISSKVKGKSLSRGTLGSFANDYGYLGPVNYQNIGLRYAAPFGLTLGGDYTRYSEKTEQRLSQGEQVLLNSLNRQSIDRWHGYVDQQHQLGIWQINYGAEYQFAHDHSSQINYPAEEGSFFGTSKEEMVDAYVGLQTSLDWGLSFNVSAKGEYFHNEYQHNWNFIPQLGATFYRTPVSIFQLDFSTIRQYPSYWTLHQRTSYINPYSKVIGNPELQPFLNYSGQLSYIFKQKYVATLYVQYGDKATVQLPYQSTEELSLVYQTINMNYKRSIGLNLNIPLNVGNIWSATFTANLFHQREKADRFHDMSFDNGKWIFYGGWNNTIKFSRNFPVSMSLDATYISPSVQGIADLSSIWKVDAGVKWQFGRSRSCELDLQANDIFNRWSPTMTITSGGQDYRMKVRDMSRNLKLTFIWRFNGFQPKETSAPDTSRFGTN